MFEPQLAKRRQRLLHGVDEMVISLTGKGLTTGEGQAHLAEAYGTKVSRETVSKITHMVLEEMSVWLNRPLEQVDVRGVHRSRPWSRCVTGSPPSGPLAHAIGVTADGTRDILGLWIGTGGQGAKF
jgi:putative transposase